MHRNTILRSFLDSGWLTGPLSPALLDYRTLDATVDDRSGEPGGHELFCLDDEERGLEYKLYFHAGARYHDAIRPFGEDIDLESFLSELATPLNADFLALPDGDGGAITFREGPLLRFGLGETGRFRVVELHGGFTPGWRGVAEAERRSLSASHLRLPDVTGAPAHVLRLRDLAARITNPDCQGVLDPSRAAVQKWSDHLPRLP